MIAATPGGLAAPLTRQFLKAGSSSMSMGEDDYSTKPSDMLNEPIMTTQDFEGKCFTQSFCLTQVFLKDTLYDAATLPTTVSEDRTDRTSHGDDMPSKVLTSPFYTPLSLVDLRTLSERANKTAAKECEARRGNLNQRWATDPQNGYFMRLVAGCVPILNDGRIILVRNSKGNSWLVPKGGWEGDERLEEAAIRECYEEAGVLGILGPKLQSFSVETRKARKRRLDTEERANTSPKQLEATLAVAECHSGWSVLSQLSEDDHLPDDEVSRFTNSPPSVPQVEQINGSVPAERKTDVRVTFQASNGPSPPTVDNCEIVATGCDLNSLLPATMEDAKSVSSHDVAGTTTSSRTHTHVCMTFFPLYVHTVRDVWPEDFRIRNAFTIDGKSLSALDVQ